MIAIAAGEVKGIFAILFRHAGIGASDPGKILLGNGQKGDHP